MNANKFSKIVRAVLAGPMTEEEREGFDELNRQFFGLDNESPNWAEYIADAKKVIEFYANEDSWNKKPTEIGEFSLMCLDDKGGTARDWLEKWGGNDVND